MPIYEYYCQKCGKNFECLVRGAQEAILCPGCHSQDIKRKISSFAFYSKDSAGNITSGSSCVGCAGSNCSSCGH